MGRTIKIILLYLVLSYSFFGVTQNVFNQSFDVNLSANASGNVLQFKANYIFTQVADYNGFAHIQAFKIDSLGNFIDSNSIVQSTKSLFYGYAGSLQHLSSSEFCQLYHIGPDSGINLVFFDSNLNVIRDQRFDFNYFLNAAVIKQINDSTLLTLGRIKNTSTYDLFLINTDLQGNERWRTTFGTSGKNDYGYSIEFINNKIIIGGQTFLSSSLGHPHVFELTPNGNLAFDTLYTQYGNGGFLTYHPNFGLYLSSSIEGTNFNHPMILKVNHNYTVQWAHEYFKSDTDASLGKIYINNDGVISSSGLQIVNNVITGLFFQIDHNGDSITSKLIDHLPGQRAQFSDIRPTSDGGYIMAGETRAPSQDSWIVKVNSWGCDNIPCIVSVSEVNENALGAFNCYPNPSSGLGTIKGNLKNRNRLSSEIRIYNTIGQLVDILPIRSDDFDFQINFPNSGLYLIQLYQGNTMISSQKWVVQ